MNDQVKDLIRRRAEDALVFTRDHLMYRNESNFEMGETLRFATLILSGPRRFLEQFRHGSLTIDQEAVERIYWDLRGQIDGPNGLLNEERILIRDHNAEVENLRTRPLRMVQG